MHRIHFRSSRWKVFCKIVFFFARNSFCGHWFLCSGRKGYSHRRLFFKRVSLPEIRAGSFVQEFMCSGARNNFRTGALPRIFNYSKESVNLPGYCKYQPVSSLRIKKNAIIFQGSKQIPQRNPIKYPNKIAISLWKYFILQGCSEFVLPIKIQNRSISQGKRYIFSRTPNFASVPLLSTE